VNSEAVPRQLTDLEREVIGHILSVDLPGVTELRGQLERAEVLREWGNSGPSIDISVPDDCVRSPCVKDFFPVDARVIGGGNVYEGELLLWLKDGRLSALEFAWVTDDAPSSLPNSTRIRLAIRD
jgi:hypothetical protein